MPAKNRFLILLGQLALLGLAAVVAFWLAEIWLLIAVFVVDAFPARPILASSVLAIICAVVLLSIVGARMAPRGIRLVSRAVLLLLSAIAALGFMEAFTVAMANAVASPSLDGYLWFLVPTLLAAFAAAGVKVAFDWRVAYWIVVVAAVATLTVATFAITVRNVL